MPIISSHLVLKININFIQVLIGVSDINFKENIPGILRDLKKLWQGLFVNLEA